MHALLCRVGLEERETDEQPRRNPKGPLGEDIRRHSPILLEYANGDSLDLSSEWHRKFVLRTFFVSASDCLTLLLFMNLPQLLIDGLAFFATFPDFMPIRALTTRAFVDNLQHELGWVFFVATFSSSVRFKVVNEGFGVLSNRSEVNRLTSFRKEQETVEFLEEDGTRLMNRAEDRLAGICQLS